MMYLLAMRFDRNFYHFGPQSMWGLHQQNCCQRFSWAWIGVSPSRDYFRSLQIEVTCKTQETSMQEEVLIEQIAGTKLWSTFKDAP